MDVQSTPPASAPRTTDAVGVVIPVVPLPASPSNEPLGPAATVELSDAGRSVAEKGPSPEAKPEASTEQARYRVDQDTRQIVFQVFDSGSGTVVEQLPDESSLRARAYARDQAEAQSAKATSKAIDKSA